MMRYEDFVEMLLGYPERENLELLAGQLCSEAGEVFGALTKIRRATYNNEPRMELWAKLDAELGDVLFYLAALAAYRGTTLEKLGAANIRKLKARKKAGKLTSGSGSDR